MKKHFIKFIKSATDILWMIGIGWMMLCGVLGYLGHTNTVLFNTWPFAISCVLVGLIFEVVRLIHIRQFK